MHGNHPRPKRPHPRPLAPSPPRPLAPSPPRPLRLIQISDSHLFAHPEGRLLSLNTRRSFQAVCHWPSTAGRLRTDW